MSITVYADHGIFDFPEANDFQVDTNDYRLDVSKDGDRIAIFNRGEWKHVEINEDGPAAVEEAPPGPEPKVWNSLAGVDYDRKVSDRYGYIWQNSELEEHGCVWWTDSASPRLTKPFGASFAHRAPFTEVIS